MNREELLRSARNLYENPGTNEALKVVLEETYPELKESEDEKIRKYIVKFIELEKGVNLPPEDADKMLAYLEKQKKQKTAEWSEEDERIYQSIMDDTVQENQLDEKQINWLRDIKYRNFVRPKNIWKPSEEKMKALDSAINYLTEHTCTPGNPLLISLYHDLQNYFSL